MKVEYDIFGEYQLHEYFRELAAFISIQIPTGPYTSTHPLGAIVGGEVFLGKFNLGMPNEESGWQMFVDYNEDISFEYYNQCTGNFTPTFKLNELFKACESRKDALWLMSYAMKEFYLATVK